MQTPISPDPARDDLDAARQAFGAVLAQALMAERDAAGRTATPPPAPTQPRLNRHERRRLAKLTRKH